MRTALAAVVAIALAPAALAQSTPATTDPTFTPREVRAPHYGDALFEFFQDKHFEAVTGLMVSQHFKRVSPHDDESELLRGGLLLSWGLHHEAGGVFERLLAQNLPLSARDRAWFFLAKIRYQRGLPDAAEAALARIEQPLPAPLQEERVLLQARLLMARAEHAAAAELLRTLPPEASAVARFNLGVALVKAGDLPQGTALLDVLGQQGAADEEQRALRDRANVALGFAALGQQLGADARRYFERVRLQGPDAGKALLGHGWAALELGEPKRALVPWGELRARPVSEASSVEAHIAWPYALAEAGASAAALDGYQKAVAAFDGERRALDQSITAIRGGAFVQALLERNPRAGMGWLGGAERLPEMPHAGHLAPILAGHEFQEAFKNLHDLVFIGRNLEGWQGKLGTYHDMLANRRQAFAERLPKMRERAGAMDIDGLEKRRGAVVAELAAVEANQDAPALADARERAHLQRIESGLATLQGAAPGDAEADAARERLRRVAGALTWQMTQQYPARLWQAQKALRGSAEAVAEARARDAALVRAAAEEPARFEVFAARIAALEQRIAGLVPQVAALRGEQAAQLQEIAVTALQAQQQRLEVYTTQARLGIAQLHDRAQLAVRRSDAPNERDGVAPGASTGTGTATEAPK
ncbi:MAG: hypothetical protein IT499_07275 [Rubrivivax sp.]|nr:hypothetical protein [Rubrivivax sp.]MCL4696674.1 hypothetical protein [Burkholderiaceae bacterium]